MHPGRSRLLARANSLYLYAVLLQSPDLELCLALALFFFSSLSLTPCRPPYLPTSPSFCACLHVFMFMCSLCVTVPFPQCLFPIHSLIPVSAIRESTAPESASDSQRAREQGWTEEAVREALDSASRAGEAKMWNNTRPIFRRAGLGEVAMLTRCVVWRHLLEGNFVKNVLGCIECARV